MGKYNRVATTVENQVDILFSRGLDITNSTEVRQKIENIGYFKLKGYCFPFYDQKDHFSSGITFDQVYESYVMDQKLHLCLLGLIVRVEAQVKSRLGSFLALKYGPLCYLDEDFFRASEYQSSFLNKMTDDEAKAENRHELYASHYRGTYENTFPIWVAFEMCSLGTLSKFFSDMKTADQKAFSRNIYGGVTNKRLENWLHYLTLVRNCCAHNSRTFKRSFATYPKFSSEDLEFCPNLATKSVFSALYILSKLCFSQNYYQSCIDELKADEQAYSHVSLHDWGFPDNWYDILK